MEPQIPNESASMASKSGLGALLASGVAAVLASACCLGPLLLLALGFSGAWIGNLTALEPYRFLFIGTALVALLFAGRSIWRPMPDCLPGEFCAVPRVKLAYQILFGSVALLILIAFGFPYVAPWFY